MLLLAAAQGLEIFAQPTPMDLFRILLAVLPWKGQVLVPGQGPNCCSGASRISVVLVLTEIPHLSNTQKKPLEQSQEPFNWNV